MIVIKERMIFGYCSCLDVNFTAREIEDKLRLYFYFLVGCWLLVVYKKGKCSSIKYIFHLLFFIFMELDKCTEIKRGKNLLNS